jgi:hypothetical protein
MRKNTEDLLEAGREVGPEINTEKTKHIVMSFHQKYRKTSGFNYF